MTSGMNFWDVPVWSFVVTMTILFAAMMIANTLRNLIKPLRKLMIPSAVLGGFIVLLADFFWKKLTGSSMFASSTLETLTYHGLGLGFVAMSLRSVEKTRENHLRRSAFDSGVLVVATYLLQGILGLVITVALYYLLDSFFASGLLLPMGFGQGPGQAYNWGRTYENMFGFVNGTSFGLTVAAMGFVSASVGGVVYLNVLRRRGQFTGETGNIVTDEDLTAHTITGKGEIPLTEAMDKFTIQLALVFIAYILAFLFMKGMNVIINTGAFGDFGFNTVQPLIWGFNFLFGTIFALLLKAVLQALKKKGVIKREYMNNFLQNRISGFMFDMMVVASIAAIDLSAFQYRKFIIPLVVLCVVGAAVTYWYLSIVCKRVYPGYRHQAFLMMYGMLTGTASTGIILLREMDPQFQTPAAADLVNLQPWAIVFGFPMLLMLSYAPQSVGKSLITAVVMIVLFVIMNLIALRRDIFKKKKKT